MKIQDPEEQKTDLIFVRHAESENNAAIFKFIHEREIQYTWENVSKSEEFINGIKYNPELIDCSITQEGIRQCKQTRTCSNYLKPNVILVSPLNRALQTCDILFGKRKIPIFVEPILTEGLRSACDISGPIKQKIQKYKNWTFSDILINDDLWFVRHQLPEMRETILQRLKGCTKETSYEQKSRKILELMKETRIYQMPVSLRERTKEIKKLIKKYKQKYETIAIVAHYNSINYTITRQFNSKHEPENSPHLNNCQMYHDSFEEIIKYE